MASRAVLVTGANRGIGLALCKALSRNPALRLIAACRNPQQAQELQDLKSSSDNVHILRLELLEFDSYTDFAGRVNDLVGPSGLNTLINNAGITTKFATLAFVKREQLYDNFAANTMAPILLTKSLLPALKSASRNNASLPLGINRAAVVNLSSILGSIGGNDKGGFYPYRCSKAALNAATRSMSVDLKRDGIFAVAMHPGWARTDMGGPNAPLAVEESVQGMLRTLETLGPEHNGGFYQYDGEELPW